MLLQDKKVRVYSKNRDKTYCAALKYAFEQWANAKLKTQPPGTPWRQSRSQQQQQQHFNLQETAAAGGGTSGRVSWGAACFGSGPDLPPRSGSAADLAAAAEAGVDANGGVEHDGVAMVLQLCSQGEQTLQVPSRKRSLTQDMQSASQQQQQRSSQAGSGGSRSGCGGFGSQVQCDADAEVDATAAVDGRPAKQSKSSSGSGGRSSNSRGGAGVGLPGIAEDAAEGK
jgi:hypothetical protein